MLPRRSWILATAVSALVAAPAASSPVLFQTHYLSAADIPAGFYQDGPDALEDFEDGSLDFGITASNGGVRPGDSRNDSVDADDGAIDGSGSDGLSWFHSTGPSGPSSITFSFPEPVTAAALVQTDGRDSVTTLEAFGPNGSSIGTWGPLSIVHDDDGLGQTDEDTFLGVQDLGGISALRITVDFSGMEVDHVQYGAAVPEPGTALLLGSGVLLLGGFRRRAAG